MKKLGWTLMWLPTTSRFDWLLSRTTYRFGAWLANRGEQ